MKISTDQIEMFESIEGGLKIENWKKKKIDRRFCRGWCVRARAKGGALGVVASKTIFLFYF